MNLININGLPSSLLSMLQRISVSICDGMKCSHELLNLARSPQTKHPTTLIPIYKGANPYVQLAYGGKDAAVIKPKSRKIIQWLYQ